MAANHMAPGGTYMSGDDIRQPMLANHQRTAPGALALAIALALAGCLGAATPPDVQPAINSAASAPASTESAAVDTPGSPPADATSTSLHNITVDVAFTSPGVTGPGGGVDPPTCAAPTDCRFGVHVRIDPANADVFDGTIIDNAWLYPDSVDAKTVAGVWVFTGTLVGCTGNGTVTMPWIGAFDPDPASWVAPDPSGDVFHQHDILTAPTNVTGFARIADVYIDADAYLNPTTGGGHGTLKGYILCE